MRASLLFCEALLASFAVAKDVYFTIDLTWDYGAPDGFSRQMILVNGTSPGPALFLNQGDNVKFLVHNNLPTNTSIHFHGITQLNTPWSDGVPGISQRPIPPGGSFLYQWTADDYGTYWYHGHDRSDISDGLYGPIHISPRCQQPVPYSLIDSSAVEVKAMSKAAAKPQLVTVSDWSHLDSATVHQAEIDSNLDLFCSNSILINGRGKVSCLPISTYMSLAGPGTLQALNGSNITAQGCSPPGLVTLEGEFSYNLSAVPPELAYTCEPTDNAPTVFHVDRAARWASFNFILSTSLQSPMISIDDHEFWIYAADGQFVHPQRVDGFIASSGQRYSALVKLKDDPAYDAYTMRFSQVGGNQIIFATSLFSYAPDGKTGTVAPDSHALYNQAGTAINSSAVSLDPSTLVPYPPIQPAQEVDATFILNAGRAGAPWRWTLSGNASYSPSITDNDPVLFTNNPTGTPAGLDTNLTLHTQNGSWVDIVIVTASSPQNPIQPPHPFHKHSNKFFVIGGGTGEFNYSSVAEAARAEPASFNLVNPPYRDSVVSGVPVPGTPTWVAIRYQSTNPGAFLLHCHLQPHFAGGMGVVILDGVDQWPEVPAEYLNGGNGLRG